MFRNSTKILQALNQGQHAIRARRTQVMTKDLIRIQHKFNSSQVKAPVAAKASEAQFEEKIEQSQAVNLEANLNLKAAENVEQVNAAVTQNEVPKTVDGKKDRGASFKVLSKADITRFEEILGAANVIQDLDEIGPFVQDFTKKYTGIGSVVLTPSTTEEISECLKYCNEQRIAVVPQGGNTGLVGGSVPLHDEVVISTKKMNQIIRFDDAQGTLYCEAGCILETLQDYAKDLGYMMPLDLGAKGSCQIGGNLATNAGGIKFIKQGSMHANCVGLEVVLADGTIVNQMNPHETLPVGYDMKQLFVGSEGTLGFITKCAIFCPPYPKNRQVCLLASNDYDQILKCLQISKKELMTSLSAVEFMDWESASIAMDYLEIENPLSDEYKFYILIEMSGNSQEELMQEQMLDLLEKLEDHYEDGVMCDSETQKDQIWHIREGISMAASGYGMAFKFDISLESKDFNNIIELTNERVGHLGGRVLGHGHIADGNLHLNTVMKGWDDLETAKKIKTALQPFVFDYVKEKGGSISAEHGVGLLKTDYLGHSKSKAMIDYMGHIKRVFDPNGILNPYKVLPDSAFKV